jgi:protein gp37
MGAKTDIEWTDSSWNPVTGCTKVSPGCDHCYAEGIAHRFAGTAAYPNGFDVTLRPERLDQPLRWKRSRRIFVNSMSDLFHDRVPGESIAQVFGVMAVAGSRWYTGYSPGKGYYGWTNPHGPHIFQILTKRPGRMRSLLTSDQFRTRVAAHAFRYATDRVNAGALADQIEFGAKWPLPGVWLGVSAEDQRWANVRIPVLLDTPAAVRFVSLEPLLGPIDMWGPLVDGWHRPRINYWLVGKPDFTGPDGGLEVRPRLDWVIVGGESGAGARPMRTEWATTIRDQCAASGVAFHFKQAGTVLAKEWGASGKGGDPSEWPELFPREYPAGVA